MGSKESDMTEWLNWTSRKKPPNFRMKKLWNHLTKSIKKKRKNFSDYFLYTRIVFNCVRFQWTSPRNSIICHIKFFFVLEITCKMYSFIWVTLKEAWKTYHIPKPHIKILKMTWGCVKSFFHHKQFLER